MNAMRAIAFISTTVVMAVLGSPLPENAQDSSNSIITCERRFCYKNGSLYRVCSDIQMECCSGPLPNEYRVYAMTNGMKCCQGSGAMYDFKKQICVSGTIRNRMDREENCGDNAVFNTSTEVCCMDSYHSGKVYNKVIGGECCKDRYLTHPDESCCEGEIYKKSEKTCCRKSITDDNQEDFPRTHYITNIPYGKCCQDVAFDPRTKSCFETEDGRKVVVNKTDSSLNRCGSSIRYDTATHGCCFVNGVPHLFVKHERICEHGVIYKKNTPRDNAVCILRPHRGYVTYQKDNFPRQVCLKNGLVTLGPQEEICGGTKHNTSEDLCCGGRKYIGAKLSGDKCCQGTNKYNPKAQTCCMGIVNDVSSTDGGMCCHNKAYNPKTHSCINREIKKNECDSFISRCQITSEKIQAMKGKLRIYTGIVTAAKSSRKKSSDREWSLKNMKEIKASKGKVNMRKSKTKPSVKLTASKCQCPESLTINTEYIFVSRSAIVKKKSLNLMGDAFVFPVSDTKSIGILFNTILEQS